MIAYHDAIYIESREDFLYIVQKMHKDLLDFAVNNWGGKLDADGNLIKESVSKGQYLNYEIRIKNLKIMLNFAVNSENLVNSLVQEFERLTEEKKVIAHERNNIKRDFENYKAVQCAPQCERICNSLRSFGGRLPNEMRREIHLKQVKQELPNLF